MHEIVFYRVGAGVRELDVQGARASGVGVAIDIDDGVFVGAHCSGEFVDDGARVHAHGGRVGIEINGAVLCGDGRCARGRLFVFDGRFGRCHGKAVRKFVDVAAIEAVFRIEGVLDDAQVAIHVLGHAEDVVVVGIRPGGAHEGAVVGVVGEFDAAEHCLGEVRRDVEIFHGADQVVGALGLGLDELDAFEPSLGEFQDGLRMLGGEVVADDEDVGDETVGDASVVDFFGAGAFGDGVAHVGIPGDGGVNFFLRE